MTIDQLVRQVMWIARNGDAYASHNIAVILRRLAGGKGAEGARREEVSMAPMTPEGWADEIMRLTAPGVSDHRLGALAVIRQCIAEEREACAQTADTTMAACIALGLDDPHQAGQCAAADIAAAIRARGKP